VTVAAIDQKDTVAAVAKDAHIVGQLIATRAKALDLLTAATKNVRIVIRKRIKQINRQEDNDNGRAIQFR